jgi:lipid II:glycine glycyltransferase (peptidoglycan interpeptide bridge formation enzyme)
MRPALPDELSRWDELVAANPDGGNVLQLRAFGETKARHGWQSQYMMMGEVAILALEKQVPLLGNFWYVPKGPGVKAVSGLKRLAQSIPKSGPFMIKIDPEIKATESEMHKAGYIEAPRDIQYNISTVVIDLKPSEDEILASFKQKTRYNVRLAGKKGVVVEPVELNQETIDKMFELYAVTTQRAGVYLRSKQYFTDFWKLHAESGHGQLFFAYFEGQVLAGAFVTFVGKKALYKDGGSVREHPEVQAPYALQWEVMRWLKGQGIEEYDLHGTPPKDQLENPNHTLAGLARFKTGFNQDVIEFIGTWDLPVNRMKYDLWTKIGERLAVAYEYRVNKQLYY